MEVVFPDVLLYRFVSGGEVFHPTYTPGVGTHFAILQGCMNLPLEVGH